MKRSLGFYNADGTEGGGAAVADPPAAPAAPAEGIKGMGDAFRREMAKTDPGYKQEVDETAAREARKAAKAKPAAPAVGDPPPADPPAEGKEKPVETKPPAKEKKSAGAKKPSALDSAFEEPAPTPQPGAEESALKGLPEKMEGKASEHWEKARNVITSLETKVRELSAANAAPRPETKQLEDLQNQLKEVTGQLDQYKDAMMELDVTYDPTIRAKFVKGRADKVNKAAVKVDAYGGDAKAFTDAMAMPEGRNRNEAIKAALGDMEADERARIQVFITDIEKLDDEFEEVKGNSTESFKKLQQERRTANEKKRAEIEANKRSIFDTVIQKLGNTVMPLRLVPSDVDGAKEWNETREQIQTDAFKLSDPNTNPEEYALAAIWRFAGPVLQNLMIKERGQLKTALAKLAEYEAAEPGFDGAKQPAKDEKPAPLGDRYRKALARERGEE